MGDKLFVKFKKEQHYTTTDEQLDGVWECVWREPNYATMKMGHIVSVRVPIHIALRRWRLVEYCQPLHENHSDGPLLFANFEKYT